MKDNGTINNFEYVIETLNIEKYRLMALQKNGTNFSDQDDLKLKELNEAISKLSFIPVPFYHQNISKIVETVCFVAGVDICNVKSNSRKRQFVNVRMVAVYFILKHIKATLQQIAGYFNVDHSSIIHYRKSVEEQIECKNDEILYLINESTPTIERLFIKKIEV